MKLNTDPGESGTESQATSLAGELERLRFAIKECKGTAEWYQTPSQNLNGITIFPVGTAVLFQQTAAPTGWTKVVTHNDKALRVVSGVVGSGGATAFTSVFGAGKNTGSTAITIAQMPSHAHGTGTTAAMNSNQAHSHTVSAGGAGAAVVTIIPSQPSDLATGTQATSSVNIDHTHNFSIPAEGGSTGHTHTESLDLQYVDCIIATKN